MRTVASSPVGKVALVTMGGQAQVVTFAVDGLLAMGESLSRVLVLHLSPEDPRVRRALSQLSAEFAGGQYRGRPLEFRHIPLQALGRPLTAITDGAEAEAVWTLARDLVAALKEEGRTLHLCIAGGPRLLALTLTTAAMLHCDHQDRLWHLYTPPEFLAQAREGAILHAPPEAGVRLIPVPLVPWGGLLPRAAGAGPSPRRYADAGSGGRRRLRRRLGPPDGAAAGGAAGPGLRPLPPGRRRAVGHDVEDAG
jgi:CRISPR-associated protein Csx14